MENLRMTKEVKAPSRSDSRKENIAACCVKCTSPMGEAFIADGIIKCPKCGRLMKVLIRRGILTVHEATYKDIVNSVMANCI